MQSRLFRLRSLAILGLLVGTTGCATILGGGASQPVAIRSNPESATFTVKASNGLTMAQGQTPQTIRLPRKNEYQIEFTAPGFQPQSIALTKGTNGWIWGNLVVGWIVGFAVDFATGSAHKLEPALVDISLVQVRASTGELRTDALVKLHDKDGRLIREVTVPMVPVEAAAK